MKRALQILLPIAVLSVSGLILYWLLATKPEPRRRNFQAPPREVVVRPLEKRDYPVALKSQGEVRARTTSNLIPEVRGRILRVAENFREGAFFEEGDVLLEIDPRDYETELSIARAAKAQADLNLLEERARGDQARLDWERLNPGEDANPLTLRVPQLRQAEAAAESAEARLETAELNLERAKIKAPFAGRVLTKNVDVGQYVSPGNQLARIYAVDIAEVRLPLTASQFAYLDLPSVYRGENPTFREGPRVTLSSEVAGNVHSWRGRIIRAEGAVDSRSRQIFVVAQVRNPYGRDENFPDRPPLKVGTFVRAEIEGKTLRDVYVMPRKLYRENSYVLMVDQEGYLARKKVHVVWETDDAIIVDKGVSEGDRLCLTYVPLALENYPVVAVNEQDASADEALVAEAEAEPRRRRRAPAGGGGMMATRIDGMLERLGDELPGELRGKLEALKASGDFSQMRPVMQEVRQWAEENGVEMPGRGGGGPRG